MKKTGIINLYLMLLTILFFISSCSCLKPTIPPDENTLTISTDGGEYNFPNGIRLSVPAGAVEEETDISLKILNHEELQPILNKYGFKEENLLVYIEGKPDGLTFNTPVELIFPSHIEGEDIPLIYDVINDTTCTIGSNSKIKINSEHNELIISVSHFSSFFAQIVTKLKDLFNIECLTDPCRCGAIEIIQDDKDFLCNNGDCQISESIVKVIFPECGLTEEAVMREISPGCVPKLVLSADSYIVPTGGQTNIMTNIKLDCAPQSGQNVDFSKSVIIPATLYPVSDNTNSDGSAQTTFTAGNEEGTVRVSARSTFSYYSSTLSATAGGIKEINLGTHITEPLLETIDIHVQDSVESWSGTISDETTYFGTIETSRHLDINFQFFVLKGDDSLSFIRGSATAQQEGSIKSNHQCWYIRDINIPSSLNLILEGFVNLNSNEIYLVLDRPNNETFFAFTQCYSCDPLAPDECTSSGFAWNVNINNKSVFTTTGSVFLSEGTHIGSWSLYNNLISSYTVTLQKDD